ncbi:hypothetical protein J6590_002497 [Homalodisca vitripennis]|nr:hypothetical protein J6590_002497 [Homalodisca vitripennis]
MSRSFPACFSQPPPHRHRLARIEQNKSFAVMAGQLGVAKYLIGERGLVAACYCLPGTPSETSTSARREVCLLPAADSDGYYVVDMELVQRYVVSGHVPVLTVREQKRELMDRLMCALQ